MTASAQTAPNANAAKMAAAVDRWIAEAQAMPCPQGEQFLFSRAEWIAAQTAAYEVDLSKGKRPAPHMVGLDAWALADARDALASAAGALAALSRVAA